MNRNKHLLFAPLGLLTITVITGAFLISSAVNGSFASTATAAVKIAASCTLTSTGGGNYSATVPNGTSAEIPGSTLSVSCNDAGGFALYAVGYSNDTIGNNNMIGQSTNIATNTSGNDSYWAMKINPTTGTTPTIENSFNNYHIVPNAHTKVASYSQSTGTGSLSVNATYKANISSTQLAGNYLGKVKYTLVHPSTEIMPHEIACDPGKICYNPNTVTVEGQMGEQSASNNASVDLWASNFSRTGYGFAGWNDKFDYSGTTYGPNETITAPSDVQTNGLSLYAVWIKSAGSIQNWNGCNSLASGATTALTDERDNQTYAVAKLADGKCWMIENLRLDNTASHNSDGTLAQGYNSSFIGLAAPESANFGSTTANSLYSTDGSTDATISGSYQDYRFPRYNNDNTNSRQSSSGYSVDGNTYSYGNYYTWHAAIADTTHYNTNNQSVTSTSLCPAGWRLPKGGNPSNATNSEFWQLGLAIMDNVVPDQNNYGSTYYSSTPTNNAGDTATKAFRKYPNNFLYSGYFNGYYFSGSSADNRGTYGIYWSSTAVGGGYSNSYDLSLYSSNSRVFPGTGSYNKHLGLAIRCTLGS